MGALRWSGFVLGFAIYALTIVSLVNTLVLPRQADSIIGRVITRIVRGTLTIVSAKVGSYERRDQILGYAGPVWLLTMLLSWLLMVWVSFALLMWPFSTGNASFGDALRLAGSGMFTLGFATPGDGAPLVLTLAAAASGIGVVSLMIAFLPTLYGAFNRREVLVTLVEALAGSPAWGPEVLARQELIDNVSSLDGLYSRWADWAADVSESHTSYRTLIFLRSPSPLRSWVVALLAMLDAAALHLSLNPLTAPPTARWFMRMGIVALRELAATLGLPFNPDPKPEDDVHLTREEFDEGVAILTRVGWKAERDLDAAWIHYRGWRVNYEQTAYAIAMLIDAPPAPWSGPRRRARRVIPPARPPHREPSPEFFKIRKTTTTRRAIRGEGPTVQVKSLGSGRGSSPDNPPPEVAVGEPVSEPVTEPIEDR
ncbi:MAG: hypothetical protein JOY80_11620 [Candidatus Dormibacteraeota bacterium]|nr:hypothetical protein [Candidatus Dormibacteraeota bacterium]